LYFQKVNALVLVEKYGAKRSVKAASGAALKS